MGVRSLPSLTARVNLETDTVSYAVSIDDLMYLGYLERRSTAALAQRRGLVCRPVALDIGNGVLIPPRAFIDNATLNILSSHVNRLLSNFLIAIAQEHYNGRLYGEVTVIVGLECRVYTHRESVVKSEADSIPLDEYLTIYME